MQDLFSYWPDIAPPVFVSPASNATFTVVIGFSIILSTMVSSSTVGVSTDFELWTGPSGTGTLAFNAPLDVLLLKVVPPLALAPGTYYIRARFHSAMKQSAWSEDRVVTGI